VPARLVCLSSNLEPSQSTPPAQPNALRILFFGPAVRRQSSDDEIAGLSYSVIIRRDGGSASWCRRLVTTVKPAAVDNRPAIDRVLRRALHGAWASLPSCDRSHGIGQRQPAMNVTADWDVAANQHRLRRRSHIKISSYNARVTRRITHTGKEKNRKTSEL